MYGLYGLKHHTVEMSPCGTDRRTDEQGKIRLLSLWMMEGWVSQLRRNQIKKARNENSIKFCKVNKYIHVYRCNCWNWFNQIEGGKSTTKSLSSHYWQWSTCCYKGFQQQKYEIFLRHQCWWLWLRRWLYWWLWWWWFICNRIRGVF